MSDTTEVALIEDGNGNNVNEEFPRRERPNPWNWNNEQMARRDMEVKAALEKHPTVPEKWLEWAWDITESKSKEELDDIVNNGKWEPLLKERTKPGVFKSVEVFEPGKDVPQLTENLASVDI